MKARESDMPESWQWEEFFDPSAIIHLLGCTGKNGDLADFGCGYGTFIFPVAKITSSMVHAFDIDPVMVDCVNHRAELASIRNIAATVRDVDRDGTGLPDESIGHAMLFNILHTADPLTLLREAFRILKDGGVLSILNWRTDIRTPRGPSKGIRPTPGQCFGWADRAGFRERQFVEFGSAAPWHYGQILIKSGSTI